LSLYVSILVLDFENLKIPFTIRLVDVARHYSLNTDNLYRPGEVSGLANPVNKQSLDPSLNNSLDSHAGATTKLAISRQRRKIPP
jgi:hypothetical protein